MLGALPTPQTPPCYRFVVRSAEEAAQLIRDQLGANARVLSVRNIGSTGWRRLFGKPRLEVIAQVPPAEPASNEPMDTASVHAETDGLAAADADDTFIHRSLAPRQFSRSQPFQPSLPDLLRRSGFSDKLVNRLAASRSFNGLGDRPLHQSLVQVADELRRQFGGRDAQPLPSRSGFFGPAGVGRTTALCKRLAIDVFRNSRAGRVVKVEFDRPNPADQLAVFCEALGISFEHYPVSPAGDDGSFAYFDLPALSVRRPQDNAALSRFFDTEKIQGRVLVLNAAYDASVLRDSYAAGRDLGATHIIFTHLDELTQWGKLWDYLLDDGLVPLFLATGPSLTGDCEEDVHGAILRRTLPGA